MNSLGFDKKPSETRVVVAMSGGVDSSVVASLLAEEGYQVIGITMQLYDHGLALKKKNACCAGQDIYDASKVAGDMGFPHYVLNYESNFKQSVIDEFVDSYLKGETPVPCIRCNQSVKFQDLLKASKDLGGDCMATGHYVQRITGEDGNSELHKAIDHTKDQSYFLFTTTNEQLEYLRFPLGGWSKNITREHAKRFGLVTADKPDSQDICFVPNGDYASVVKEARPDAEKPGDIVDIKGNVIGRHNGVIHYTIGQRKGLGIGGGISENNDPFYVIAIDAKSNKVIAGHKKHLAKKTISIKDCNWLNHNLKAGDSIEVKFRSVMKTIPAKLKEISEENTVIEFETPQYGIARGQAAVCYDGWEVLGGGWIYSAD